MPPSPGLRPRTPNTGADHEAGSPPGTKTVDATPRATRRPHKQPQSCANTPPTITSRRPAICCRTRPLAALAADARKVPNRGEAPFQHPHGRQGLLPSNERPATEGRAMGKGRYRRRPPPKANTSPSPRRKAATISKEEGMSRRGGNPTAASAPAWAPPPRRRAPTDTRGLHRTWHHRSTTMAPKTSHGHRQPCHHGTAMEATASLLGHHRAAPPPPTAAGRRSNRGQSSAAATPSSTARQEAGSGQEEARFAPPSPGPPPAVGPIRRRPARAAAGHAAPPATGSAQIWLGGGRRPRIQRPARRRWTTRPPPYAAAHAR